MTAPRLSVVIKTLNEAQKIEACLRSILAATDPATTEIIVADSISTDDTVAIASRFPVTVVQMKRIEDRGCGSGAQLGFQHATGDLVLQIDGDMELVPDFLPAAIAALERDPKLGGVAGTVVDRVMTLEFQRRTQKSMASIRPGIHRHLAMGGLYRMAALRQSGYLTDRNLHACEELELGMRLTALGWTLLRLDTPWVYHNGHSTQAFRLLLMRWRTKYLFGSGELLRAKLGTSQWRRSVMSCAVYFPVIAWWGILLAGIAALVASGGAWAWWIALLAVAFGPLALQVLRKRSLRMGLFSMGLLNFHAAGLIVGFLRPRVDPMRRIDSVILHAPPPAGGKPL